MITREEILMGRDIEYPLTAELEANLAVLLHALNKLRSVYGIPMFISSGYRPGKYNKLAGGARNSSHLYCQAVDFKDKDGRIKQFCQENEPILVDCGLWMEDPGKTPTWCHLQTRPASKRIFKIGV